MLATSNTRVADYPIDQLFLERWSPRAFTAEPIPEDDLMTMLEASRWAASSYNSQPWRFVYARGIPRRFDQTTLAPVQAIHFTTSRGAVRRGGQAGPRRAQQMFFATYLDHRATIGLDYILNKVFEIIAAS